MPKILHLFHSVAIYLAGIYPTTHSEVKMYILSIRHRYSSTPCRLIGGTWVSNRAINFQVDLYEHLIHSWAPYRLHLDEWFLLLSSVGLIIFMCSMLIVSSLRKCYTFFEISISIVSNSEQVLAISMIQFLLFYYLRKIMNCSSKKLHLLSGIVFIIFLS